MHAPCIQKRQSLDNTDVKSQFLSSYGDKVVDYGLRPEDEGNYQ
jgi:hypothetical protein